MLGIGVQTKSVVKDEHPAEGFALLKDCGFAHADFSLNGYLLNTDLYQNSLNKFFDKFSLFNPLKMDYIKPAKSINSINSSLVQHCSLNTCSAVL